MFIVSFFLLIASDAQLTVLAPSELVSEFANGQIPFDYILYGSLAYNTIQEFSLVIPADSFGCADHTSTFPVETVLLLTEGECDNISKMHYAERALASGVIIVDSSYDSRIPQYLKSYEISIFGLRIDFDSALKLLKFSGIRLSLLNSLARSENPTITLGLSGVNYINHLTVLNAFRYLSGSECTLEVKFEYLDCIGCSPETMEKHCIGSLCLMDPSDQNSGADMVRNSFKHICTYKLSSEVELFLAYMLRITTNCSQNYQDCTEWAFDSVYDSDWGLQECVDDLIENALFYDLQASKSTPTPGISAGEVPVLTDGNTRDVLCLLFEESASVCSDYCDGFNQCLHEVKGNSICDENCNCFEELFDCEECNRSCPLFKLGNQECDKECDKKECFYDSSDCESCSCDLTKLYNGVCDSECNNKECGYDGSDCQLPFFEVEEEGSNDSKTDFSLIYSLGIPLFFFALSIFIGVGWFRRKRRRLRNIPIEGNCGDDLNKLLDLYLPVEEFSDNTKKKGDDTCSICLADLEHGDCIRKTKCQHVFHKECIQSWVRAKRENPHCPNCNMQLINRDSEV